MKRLLSMIRQSGRLTRNSGWALGATSVAAITLFVEIAVLAHYLSPAELGTQGSPAARTPWLAGIIE